LFDTIFVEMFQEDGVLIESFDGCFGLPHKKATGLSVRKPLHCILLSPSTKGRLSRIILAKISYSIKERELQTYGLLRIVMISRPETF
jgi:hypothetical protein